MNSMSKRGFRWFVSAILVTAIVTNSQPVFAFSTAIHERVTRNALPFLTDRIQDIIVDGNEDEDEGKERICPGVTGRTASSARAPITSI